MKKYGKNRKEDDLINLGDNMAIHKLLHVAGNKRYLCLQACNVTEGKYSWAWRNVTCKNCLRFAPERGRVKRWKW